MELLTNQFFAFAATVVIGMAAGFCYDYYSVVREVLRLRRIGTWLGDIIFWLFITAGVFLLLLRGNWGELRLYVLIGLSLGALTYFRLLSGGVKRAMRLKFFLLQKSWELMVKALLFTWAVFIFPFRLAALGLSYPLNFLKKLSALVRKKIKNLWYNLAGRRLEQGAARIRSRLGRLAFWRKKEQ